MTHIISKQVFEVLLDQREKNEDIQNRISQSCKTSLYEVISSEFDHCDIADGIIRIDRLDLDIGKIHLEALEVELAEKVGSSLREALSGLVYKVQNDIYVEGVKLIPAVESRHWPQAPENNREEARENSSTAQLESVESYFEAFNFFLEKGYFPWWVKSEEKEANGIVKRLLKEQWTDRMVLQMSIALSVRVKRFRFVSACSEDNVAGICARTLGMDERPILRLMSVLKPMAPFIERGIYNDGEYRSIILKESFVEYLMADKSLINSNSGSIELLSRILAHQFKYVLVPPDKSIIQVKMGQILSECGYTNKTDKFMGLPAHEMYELANKKGNPQTAKWQDSVPVQDSEENFQVENAGLILCWPYLEYLFKGLSLISDNQEFISEEHQWRAIHLLQFIATGKEECAEDELLLNKLLCNYQVSAPLPLSFTLSELEKAECRHMLEVIIQNWKALKNTTVTGLREAFINREGILIKQPDSWLLQLEKRSYDLLLDKISWPISMVKLPWMDQFIHIKW